MCLTTAKLDIPPFSLSLSLSLSSPVAARHSSLLTDTCRNLSQPDLIHTAARPAAVSQVMDELQPYFYIF